MLSKRCSSFLGDVECELESLARKRGLTESMAKLRLDISKSEHTGDKVTSTELALTARSMGRSGREREEQLSDSSRGRSSTEGSTNDSSEKVLHRRTRRECDYSLSPVHEFANGNNCEFSANGCFHIPGIKKIKSFDEKDKIITDQGNSITIEEVSDEDSSSCVSPESSGTDGTTLSAFHPLVSSFSNMTVSPPSGNSCTTLSLFYDFAAQFLPPSSLPESVHPQAYFQKQYELQALNDMKDSARLFGKLAHNLATEKFVSDISSKISHFNHLKSQLTDDAMTDAPDFQFQYNMPEIQEPTSMLVD